MVSIGYVEYEQSCCTWSEEMLVKSIDTTTTAFKLRDERIVWIWKEAQQPKISELNLADEDRELIDVVTVKRIGTHINENPWWPILYRMNKMPYCMMNLMN